MWQLTLECQKSDVAELKESAEECGLTLISENPAEIQTWRSESVLIFSASAENLLRFLAIQNGYEVRKA